mgnify:FL=1
MVTKTLLDGALRFSIRAASVPWEAVCIPETEQSGSWSLKDLYCQDDTSGSIAARLLAARLGAVLDECNVVKARAPSVAPSSGKIVDHLELKDEILLPQRIRLFRNRELPADGTLLRKRGDAFVMSGGGCPVIVLTGASACVVAHASRESLLPKEFEEDGRPHEEHESVVEASIRKLRELEPGLPLDRASLRVLFGITPKQFRHPVHDSHHGPNNRGRQRYLSNRYGEEAMANFIRDPEGEGYLDLNALTVHQARECGIENAKTGSVLPARGGFAHTRHPNPSLAKGRNLVVVHRLG